jgi:hypothetical protein
LGHGGPQITETTDTESVDKGAHRYNVNSTKDNQQYEFNNQFTKKCKKAYASKEFSK